MKHRPSFYNNVIGLLIRDDTRLGPMSQHILPTTRSSKRWRSAVDRAGRGTGLFRLECRDGVPGLGWWRGEAAACARGEDVGDRVT